MLQRRNHKLAIARPQRCRLSIWTGQDRLRVRPRRDDQGVAGLVRVTGAA